MFAWEFLVVLSGVITTLQSTVLVGPRTMFRDLAANAASSHLKNTKGMSRLIQLLQSAQQSKA